jgi:hypothetical protein
VRHGLGFRRRRLRPHHPQARVEEQVALKAESAAGLTAWPEDWELICGDAATVRRYPTMTAPWGLVDAVPDVPPGMSRPRRLSTAPWPR